MTTAASRPRRAWAFVLAAAAAGLQSLLFWIERSPAARKLWGDVIMYRDLAARWARGEAPEIDPLWPPLYVWFLGLFEPLGGPGAGLVVLVQVALLGLAAWALCALAERWTGSPAVGLVAAGLFLLDPQVAAFGNYLWPEALHLALFLGLLWLLTCHGQRVPALIASGLVLGVALLTKSLLLPFVPVLLFPLVAQERAKGLLRAVSVCLVAGLVVLPTVLDQGRRHGVYAVADSSRFNLWVGLNDRSRKSLVGEIVGDEYQRYRASGATLAARNARLQEQIDSLVQERGVPALAASQLGKQYFRLFDKDSFFTAQLPSGAIASYGYGYRALSPQLTSVLRAWSYALYALVLAAAGLGVARLQIRRPWLLAGVLFVAGNLLLFLGLHVKSRYRLQFLPFLDLYAAVALVALLRPNAVRSSEAVATGSGPRWLAGALVAALLLFLAFGSFV